MAITGFTADFTGRTLDINVLHVATYTNNQNQPTTVEFGNPSQYITGIGKLVQKYAIMFLTQIGSQANFPTFGTNFLSILSSGVSSVSRLDIQHLFNFANLAILAVLKPYQAANPTIPLDEQLQSAKLSNFSYTNGVLSISIAITSAAGVSLVFVLPVPLT